MSTGAQEHKSKKAQIACAAIVYALVPVQCTSGLSPGERFNAMHNFSNYNSSTNNWFIIALLVLLTLSIVVLAIATLYSKFIAKPSRANNNEVKKKWYRAPQDGSPVVFEPQKENEEKQRTNTLPSGIEQRLSNIEKQLSEIGQRLTYLEKEIINSETTEDDTSAETQILATSETGRPITGEDKK